MIFGDVKEKCIVSLRIFALTCRCIKRFLCYRWEFLRWVDDEKEIRLVSGWLFYVDECKFWSVFLCLHFCVRLDFGPFWEFENLLFWDFWEVGLGHLACSLEDVCGRCIFWVFGVFGGWRGVGWFLFSFVLFLLWFAVSLLIWEFLYGYEWIVWGILFIRCMWFFVFFLNLVEISRMGNLHTIGWKTRFACAAGTAFA